MRYQLKTPWRNGKTHVEFEPIEFIAKLAALVPPPRGKQSVTDAEPADVNANDDQRTPDERRRESSPVSKNRTPFGQSSITVGFFKRCFLEPEAVEGAGVRYGEQAS